MAFITADRVKDTSTTTGTGNITVSGSAPFGYRTFSTVLSVGDTFYYAIQGQSTAEWEIGVGTYASTNQFARTTVLASSASGSAVSFSSGTKNVFITLAAARTLQLKSGATPTAGSIPYGDGSTLSYSSVGTTGQVLVSGGSGSPTWSSAGTGSVTSVAVSGGTTGLTTSGNPVTTSGTITIAGTLATANGGTGGTATPTAGTIPYGTGTALAYSAAGTSGQVLTSGGTGAPTWSTITGTGTVTSVNVSGGTTGLTYSGGPITGSGTITMAGTLAVANGGTGATTLTANNVILGNGTSAVQFVAPGTSGNILTSNGTTWISSAAGSIPTPSAIGQIPFSTNGSTYTATQKIVQGTVNAGGTNPFPSSGGPVAVDFTSIPSWVKRITVMLDGVSTNGTSNLLFQLGDSGGVELSGYLGSGSVIGAASVSSANFTTGFGVNGALATYDYSGNLIICLQDAATNTWTANGFFGSSTLTATWFTSGKKATSATLDRIRITTVGGTDTFDAGSINIMYE